MRLTPFFLLLSHVLSSSGSSGSSSSRSISDWSNAIPAGAPHSNSSTSNNSESQSRSTARDFIDDEYGHAFIEMTPKNIKDSGVQKWYGDWVREAREKDHDMYAKYGEVNYFGMKFLKDEDYHCGITLKGCNRRLTWPEILDMNPEDAELARRIYFVTKMQNIVNLVFQVVYDVTLAAQVAADGLIPKAIMTFTQQKNRQAEDNCRLVKDAVKALITITLDVAMLALTESDVMAPLYDPDKWKKIFGMAWTKFVVTKGADLIRGQTMGPLSTGFDNSDICTLFGGNFDPQNEDHTNGLRFLMDKVVQNYRSNLAVAADSVNSGTAQPEPGSPSVLSNLMFLSTWVNEGWSLDIIKNPSILEKQFRTQFTQYLVSTAARSSVCYIKCNTQILAEEYATDPRDDLRDYRFSPRPNKVCQLQCFTQLAFPYETPFYGYYELANDPWNIDIKKEMRNAYESYKKFGNQDGLGLWNVIPSEKQSYFRLPVCDSNVGYVDITDFKRNNDIQQEAFPISCGGWQSEEMPAFISSLGIQVGSAPQTSGRMNHLFFNIMPREMDNIIKWPLDHFLAYCQLDMRFYQKHGNAWNKLINEVDLGRSQYCDQVKNNTQYMPHFEANLEFCTGDFKDVFFAEGDRISTDLMNLGSSRNHCGKLMKFLNDDHPEYAGVAEAKRKWDQFYDDNKWKIGLDGW